VPQTLWFTCQKFNYQPDQKYCRAKAIQINLRFGLDYTRAEKTDPQKELQVNFMDLAITIEDIVNR